jgi:hypothetical protein
MAKANTQLTYLDAIKLFEYDPISGRLEWAVTQGKVRKGSEITSDVKVTGLRYAPHRVIWLLMTGKLPKDLIDHVNGNHLDNRWDNLRQATNQQNQFNKQGYGSFAKGVVFKSDGYRSKPWSARIRINGKKITLGSFKTHDEAAEAYITAAEKVQGPYAVHNRREIN